MAQPRPNAHLRRDTEVGAITERDQGCCQPMRGGASEGGMERDVVCAAQLLAS